MPTHAMLTLTDGNNLAPFKWMDACTTQVDHNDVACCAIIPYVTVPYSVSYFYCNISSVLHVWDKYCNNIV